MPEVLVVFPKTFASSTQLCPPFFLPFLPANQKLKDTKDVAVQRVDEADREDVSFCKVF